ncbi:MAG TPA: hypothetical protein VGI26_03755 [Solirubrobacteraceae bacterium]|jgi:hypothetical protein
MTSIPLKPQYGPTLGRLLEPRWRAAPKVARVMVVGVAVALLVLAVGGALTLLNASYSHGGRVPFSFSYKGLYRTTPDHGGYVKVASISSGRLRNSFAVAPIVLAPYTGSVTGELPLFASGYIHTLERRFADFKLKGEGKTRITSTLAGYDVRYTMLLDGRAMYGRDIMLMPPGRHVLEGVVIEMLTDEHASVAKPVANSGVLETPLKTFAFG